MLLRKRPTPAVRFAATAALMIACVPMTEAWADLKMVSEVTVTQEPAEATLDSSGIMTLPPPATFTTLYKGRKARRESSDGTVVVYDRDADKVYTLNPHQKTYSVRSFKETFKAAEELPEPLKDRMSLSTSINLDEANDGKDSKDNVGKSRTVAGKEAALYSLFASMSLSPKEFGGGGGPGGGGRGGGGFPGGGGGRRGGGGFPGGGGGGFPGGGSPDGGGPGGASRRPMPHQSMSGDVWAASSETLLPNGKKDEKEMLLALTQQMLPQSSPVLNGLADRLAKKHLVPLQSRVTLRAYGSGSSLPSQEGDGPSAPEGSGPNSTRGPVVTRMKVIVIDTSVNLPDALFRLPEGLERVDPPTVPLPFGSRIPGGTENEPGRP